MSDDEQPERDPRGRFRGGNAKGNPNRRAWIELPDEVDLVLIDIPEDEQLYSTNLEHEQGWTPTLLLYIAKGKTRAVTIDLTLSTAEELDKFEEFMMLAIQYAREHAVERDTRALEAHDEGTAEVLFHRLYRPVPVMVDRTREVLRHRARLQERSDEDAGDDGTDAAE